jgi:subtilisin family serine protease
MPFRIRCVLPVAALIVGLAAPSAMAGMPGGPSAESGAPLAGAKASVPPDTSTGDIVPGEYIVQVQNGKDPKKLATDEGAKPKFVYHSALNGFSAKLTDKQLVKVKRHPNVTSVEPVRELKLQATQYNPVWGLDRMDQRYLALSRSFTYSGTGTGVRAYVIDSGIYTAHPEFGGRAAVSVDFTGGNGQDCNGHGTHVAGTIGGASVGMAKNVMLRSVRIYDCAGNSRNDAAAAAVDWIRTYGIRPAVVNMSLSTKTGTDPVLVTAVNNLANAGFFVAVAAGNQNVDSCQRSPGNAAGALTVAASDVNDVRAAFSNWASNWGACVDVYAPGVDIYSAAVGGGYRFDGGTSMATPHVAGMVAAAKSYFGDGYTTQAWIDWVKSQATPGVIRYNPSGTANRLAFKGAF